MEYEVHLYKVLRKANRKCGMTNSFPSRVRLFESFQRHHIRPKGAIN